MLIREIILENFMSYEYSRIPLKPGLNIVCGPNGSGKSSIILAISVALGQTYTERSRKLSDLIRWGKDNARVTLVFNNTPQSGRRPVAKFNVDFFRISRYLKKDGSYWFEANFKQANKSEITRILSEFGLDPDNMLIIMHQHTMEGFSLTGPSQKLLMFEEAIGLAKHRQSIREAQQRLTHALSEEESLKSLLTNAEQTLAYWKSEYERYQRRKELLQKKASLERELIWAQFIKQEKLIELRRSRVKRKEAEISAFEKNLTEVNELITALSDDLTVGRYDQRKAFHSYMNLEKERAKHEIVVTIQQATLEKCVTLQADERISKNTYVHSEDFEKYVALITSQITSSEKMLREVDGRIKQTQKELSRIEKRLNSTTKSYLDARVDDGILRFRLRIAEDELEDLKAELRDSQGELEPLSSLLEKAGPKMETNRSPQEVTEEIRITNAQLMSFADVSEEVEQMYCNYLRLFTELREKAAIVSENRAKTLDELEERKKTWRTLIQSTLEVVDVTYQKFLSRIGATGYLRLINTQDLESAGLELLVGFKGAEPKILDSYTQSGGERSASTMAFLIALQQHLKSPFRAIDEFDVHMDPRNREVISSMLLKEVSGNKEIQYLTITPGQIAAIEKDVHVITVQNISGKSEIKVTA